MSRRSEAGFVYGEAILAVALVGSALAAVVAAMGAGMGHLELASQLSVAERLHREAYQLMDQESLEATLARHGATYDPPRDAMGNLITTHPGFSQRVVEAVWVADTRSETPPMNHLRVTVEIAGPRGPLGARTWLRSRR